MGNNSFGPYLKQNGCFTVLNVSNQKKTLQIFNNPILYGGTRDLLAIRGVTEADIRGSLLKGELNIKIRAGDIVVVCSDIDLLQFNSVQKQFLLQAGITNGLEVEVPPGTLNYTIRQDIILIGDKNNVNRTYKTPEKFINGNYSGNLFKIQVTHNGKRLFENTDFIVKESVSGLGFDVVEMISFTPNSLSDLRCSYYVSI